MKLGKIGAKRKEEEQRIQRVGHGRRYLTLCRVLDVIRNEATSSSSIYRPAPTNQSAVIQARSRALLHLYLKAKFGLVDFREREHYVTDGSGDGGIDAYYIDKRSKCVHLIQAKFRASAENFSSSEIGSNDLLKMDVKRILRGEKKNEQGVRYNDAILKNLIKDVQAVSDIGNYATKVVILGNNTTFSQKEVSRLVEGYEVEQVPHDRIYSDLLFPVVSGTYYAAPNLTIEIQYEGNLQQVEHSVKADGVDTTISLFFVPTKEIGRVMSLYKNSILKYNPRSFLELSKNTVNQEIRDSLKSATGNSFALFNNGVTIVSEGTKVTSDTARRGIGQIVLTNPQLINGGQTAYTLATLYADVKSKKLKVDPFKGKQVLLRVITFVVRRNDVNAQSRQQLIAAISRASNSQTKVDESDRRSGDPIQLELQRHFFESHGLYYERKKGEFSDGCASGYINKEMMVDRQRLVRVALAIQQKPHLARSSVEKYFHPGVLETLFKVSEVSDYVYGYEVLKLVESARKEKPVTKGDKYNTKLYGQGLRYGQYALVAACAAHAREAGESPKSGLTSILGQWPKYEAWVSKKVKNKAYKIDGAFDFANYYKGATVGRDIQEFNFTL